MKKSFILFLLLSVIFISCSSDENQNVNISEGKLKNELIKDLTTLHDAAKVYTEQLESTGDSIVAISSMLKWLSNIESVVNLTYHNIEYIEVELENGLTYPITFIPVSSEGEHLRRGGGDENSIKPFLFNELNTKRIKNEKALVLIPYPDEFFYSNNEITNLQKSLESGAVELEAEIKVGLDVKLSDLDNLGEYGLIILDVHGLKNGFFLAYAKKRFKSYEIIEKEKIIDEIFDVHSIPSSKIENGQIKIGLEINTSKSGTTHFNFNILITEDYIRQLDIDLTDAVLFGNHCYSGHTADGKTKNNMPEAWRSKGVATYYGYAGVNNYSAPIDNEFCKAMETELIKGLVKENDSTGNAHLKFDESEYFYLPSRGYKRAVVLGRLDTVPPTPESIWPLYFLQYFDNNYKYTDCPDEIVDKRDGKIYKTVCIGNQTWMAENLRFSGAGICFENEPSYCKEKGRLYTVFELLNRKVSTETESVRGLCPEGWHVPSNQEYEELIDFVGGENSAIIKLRSKDWPFKPTPTDEFGFNLLPTESAFFLNSENEMKFFPTKNPQTLLWTSSGTVRNDGNDSYSLFETRSTNRIGVIGTSQSIESKWYYPCRCIKDKK